MIKKENAVVAWVNEQNQITSYMEIGNENPCCTVEVKEGLPIEWALILTFKN